MSDGLSYHHRHRARLNLRKLPKFLQGHDRCLAPNGVQIAHGTEEAGDLICDVAQRRMDEDELAAWLRRKAVG